MEPHVVHTNRRRLLSVSLAGGTALAFALGASRGAAQDVATPGAEIGRVDGIPWEFAVLGYQDPYGGTLLVPELPDPDTRYIGIEIEIINGSSEALDFDPYEVRLVDIDGVQLRSGGVVGSEPRINALNLVSGERSRGWIYFGVTSDAEPAEILYIAPPPQLRIPIRDA